MIPDGEIEICGKKCVCRPKYVAETRCDLSLTPIYRRWYPNGKKHVPEDLVLTPLTVAHWFCGDGTSSYRPNNGGIIVSFATDCFTFDECEVLAYKLNTLCPEFSFNAWCNKSRKNQPRIRTGNKTSVSAFFDCVTPVLSKYFSYKIKSR